MMMAAILTALVKMVASLSRRVARPRVIQFTALRAEADLDSEVLVFG